jgi:hypothetical protein
MVDAERFTSFGKSQALSGLGIVDQKDKLESHRSNGEGIERAFAVRRKPMAGERFPKRRSKKQRPARRLLVRFASPR